MFMFMPFVLDKFGNVLEDTKEMLYQMFLRKAFNDKHDITESKARFIATRKLRFWLLLLVINGYKKFLTPWLIS